MNKKIIFSIMILVLFCTSCLPDHSFYMSYNQSGDFSITVEFEPDDFPEESNLYDIGVFITFTENPKWPNKRYFRWASFYDELLTIEFKDHTGQKANYYLSQIQNNPYEYSLKIENAFSDINYWGKVGMCPFDKVNLHFIFVDKDEPDKSNYVFPIKKSYDFQCLEKSKKKNAGLVEVSGFVTGDDNSASSSGNNSGNSNSQTNNCPDELFGTWKLDRGSSTTPREKYDFDGKLTFINSLQAVTVATHEYYCYNKGNNYYIYYFTNANDGTSYVNAEKIESISSTEMTILVPRDYIYGASFNESDLNNIQFVSPNPEIKFLKIP